MVDIAAPPSAVRQALTTQPGVTAWWTDRAEVPSEVGQTLRLTFPGAPAPFDLQLVEASDRRVVWRTQTFPPNWVGTEVRWDLSPVDAGGASGTRVDFSHAGWQPDDPGIGSVTYIWAHLLGVLKTHVETGQRQPYFVTA